MMTIFHHQSTSLETKLYTISGQEEYIDEEGYPRVSNTSQSTLAKAVENKLTKEDIAPHLFADLGPLMAFCFQCQAKGCFCEIMEFRHPCSVRLKGILLFGHWRQKSNKDLRRRLYFQHGPKLGPVRLTFNQTVDRIKIWRSNFEQLVDLPYEFGCGLVAKRLVFVPVIAGELTSTYGKNLVGVLLPFLVCF